MEAQQIENFQGYVVFPSGQIWSVGRNKQLKQCVSGNGYAVIKLRDVNGNFVSKYPHQLVANAFLAPSEKTCIDHINGDKTDNRIENLRWADYADNNANKHVSRNKKYSQ